MTAQGNEDTETDPLYFHIYREVAKEEIFIDDQDYREFLNFLRDYFSDTKNLESAKQTFTVRGRTYRGVPHQPQNFFNQIELLAYKLEPNRFDLLIKQIVPGTLEKFIRAISTRYALYFNKRHHRAGTLFKDSYKLSRIKDLSSLLHLTRNFHSNFSNKDGVPAYYYSSYPEYLGQRETAWIKSQVVLSIEGVSDYKSFVEGGKSKKSTKEHTSLSKSKPRIPEILLATVILILFSSYSVRNIKTSTAQSNDLISLIPTSSPQVSGVKDVKPEPETILVIKITDGAESVNLRKEPATKSEKIGKAKDGEKFELVSKHSGWYEIKLDDNSIAFVSARYAQIEQTEGENN